MSKTSTIGEEVSIVAGNVTVQGNLVIPKNAKGIVLFAHGSGSSRFSPRNQYVAKQLQQGNIATLLMDLLTLEEDAIDAQTREFRFDINLLATRLQHATDWLAHNERTHKLGIGYFGSSTGAAAALIAAAEKGKSIKTVVSRGGRPDLAGPFLVKVQSPTLLIVGGNDYSVIELNQEALNLLHCKKKMEIVPGATHLFEEPGKLEQVAQIARAWFTEFL